MFTKFITIFICSCIMGLCLASFPFGATLASDIDEKTTNFCLIASVVFFFIGFIFSAIQYSKLWNNYEDKDEH
ncbi:MAG: hypothetical protein HFJ20_04305 [Clostridia bacterium]|nr:hypothetical protein [Clostridia bacterium]MCI8832878.1 hypothetical protein [Clostridia bacterium]